MISPSKRQNPRVQRKVGQSFNGSATRKVKRQYLLRGKKYYLDVKNRRLSSNLEEELKSYGAVISVFLERDVNVVVTDRTDWATCGLSSPQCVTPTAESVESPATSDWSGEGPGRRRLTRAEAMLERVRQQPQQKTLDPLHNAVSWGIPIWSVEKIQKQLEHLDNKCKSAGRKLTVLKGTYIKVEDHARTHRPFYCELRDWPAIRSIIPLKKSGAETVHIKSEHPLTEGENVHGIVDEVPAPERPRMTRTARLEPAPSHGYCEICQCNFSDQLTHLHSEQHVLFVRNEANFLCLDKIINKGSSIESFLNMNGITTDLSPCPMFGSTRRSLRSVVRVHPLDTSWKGKANGYHATRSSVGVRQSLDERHSIQETVEVECNGCPRPNRARKGPYRSRPKSASFCCDEGESGHQLRSRGQMWLPRSLLGTTAEDEGNPARLPPAPPPPPPPARRKSRSIEEKLIEENKTWLKLDGRNNKLRSSRHFFGNKNEDLNTAVEKDVPKCNGEHKVVVKVKKKPRRTELSVLSDEAESFMFGEPTKRDMSGESSDDESEEKPKVTNVTNKATNSPPTVTTKTEPTEHTQVDDNSINSADTSSVGSSCDTNSTHRRKRRTHAEAFIHDNLDYYKFEIPGSRLRYQGSSLPSPNPAAAVARVKKEKKLNEKTMTKVMQPKDESNKSSVKVTSTNVVDNRVTPAIKDDITNDSGICNSVVNDLHFSFETAPQGEPWYQTYQRQDEGEEFYFSNHDPVYWRPFLLPYEMPKSDHTGAHAAGGQSALMRKKKRRFSHLLDKKPRKSPRCHASTLAILSSLMRRRKDPENPREEEPSTSNEGLPEEQSLSHDHSVTDLSAGGDTPGERGEEEEEREEDDIHNIAHSIDKMLGLCSVEVAGEQNKDRLKLPMYQEEAVVDPAVLQELAANTEQQPDYALRCRGGPGMDLLQLLDGYHCCRCSLTREPEPPESSCNSSECGASSTCEVPPFRDSLGRRLVAHGRKRKRKKNLTGWPIDKQKRRKALKKLDEMSEAVISNCVSVSLMAGNNGVRRMGIVNKTGGKFRKVYIERSSESFKPKEDSGVKVTKVCDTIVSGAEEKTNVNGVLDSMEICSGVTEPSSEGAGPLPPSQVPKSVEQCLSVSRTSSLDSLGQTSDLQPCVRMMKMSLSEAVSLTQPRSNAIPNNRRLRSASVSLTPVVKKLPSKSVKSSPVRRASPRKKNPRFRPRWGAWSSYKRR